MALYLVTGGAGFIGSNIVEELLKRGEKIRVLDNFATGKRENLFPFFDKIELIEGDIRSYHIVKEAVDGIDFILHQAALPSVPRSIKDPITTNEVNVVGTLNILNAALDAKVKRVIYASSSSIYGNSEILPKREDMIPNPISPYAVSKLAGEKYCHVFSQIYGLETVCLRYFNVFGPKQNPNSEYSAVIPKFINSFLKDEPPIIYGDGTQSRDFTYVANIVDANIKACNIENINGEIFNIAVGKSFTLLNLVDKLIKRTKKNIQPIYKEIRGGDVKHSLASIIKAREKLNYQPSIDFNEGLDKTYKFFNL